MISKIEHIADEQVARRVDLDDDAVRGDSGAQRRLHGFKCSDLAGVDRYVDSDRNVREVIEASCAWLALAHFACEAFAGYIAEPSPALAPFQMSVSQHFNFIYMLMQT